MKLKFRFRIIILFASLSILSCSNSTDKNSSFQANSSFVNYKTNSYTISYPKTWKVKSSENTIAFAAPKENEKDVFEENVNVNIQDLSSQPMTLNQYTSLSKQQIIGAMGASAIISIKRITVDTKPADEVIYKMNFQGKDFKVKGIWLVVSNKAFVVTYTAEANKFDKYLSDADKTIKTFKVL